MKKRIYLNMMLLTVSCLLLFACAISVFFYLQFSRTAKMEIQGKAEAFRDNTAASAIAELSPSNWGALRFSVIAADGDVLYDNTLETTALENHKDREEVQKALEFGTGESRRFSASMETETYFHAIRLADGAVLRIAKTVDSIWGMFSHMIPTMLVFLIIIVLLGYLLTIRLTKRIVAPIQNALSDTITTPVYDELSPLIRTIQNQKAHMHAQRMDFDSQTHTINRILDNMSDGFLMIDANHFIITANQSAVNILGEGSPIVGKNILEVSRNIEILAGLESASQGKRLETSISHGSRIYHLYFSPSIHDNIILLLLDITEREQSEQIRREFSANVSHELKTPLTSICGYAEMLASGMIAEKDMQHCFQKLQSECTSLIALVDDIMLISRLDETTQQPMQRVDLCASAAEAAQALQEKADTQGVSIVLPDDPIMMSANKTMLYELFYNLIDNAIKYNQPQGKITITMTEQKDTIQVVVTDTGIGIPLAAQGRVFERFYRVDASRSKKTGGSGLGLSIVKHIVKQHNGQIALESIEGKGTKISISFPK